jgi:hypothetical protein
MEDVLTGIAPQEPHSCHCPNEVVHLKEILLSTLRQIRGTFQEGGKEINSLSLTTSKSMAEKFEQLTGVQIEYHSPHLRKLVLTARGESGTLGQEAWVVDWDVLGNSDEWWDGAFSLEAESTRVLGHESFYTEELYRYVVPMGMNERAQGVFINLRDKSLLDHAEAVLATKDILMDGGTIIVSKPSIKINKTTPTPRTR